MKERPLEVTRLVAGDHSLSILAGTFLNLGHAYAESSMTRFGVGGVKQCKQITTVLFIAPSLVKVGTA